MIKARFVLCAETVIRDHDRNSMSAIQIFESVKSPGLPLLVHQLATLAMFVRDSDDPITFHLKFRLQLDEEKLVENDVTVVFAGGVFANRTIIRVMGIVFQKPGTIKAGFYENDREVGSYEFKIEITPPRAEIQSGDLEPGRI